LGTWKNYHSQCPGISIKWENPTLLPGLTCGPCLSASVPAYENKHQCKNIIIFNTKHKKMKKKFLKDIIFSAMIKQKYMSFKMGKPDITAGFNYWREPFTPLLVKTNITAKI
jgi:hypothetical protein